MLGEIEKERNIPTADKTSPTLIVVPVGTLVTVNVVPAVSIVAEKLASLLAPSPFLPVDA